MYGGGFPIRNRALRGLLRNPFVSIRSLFTPLPTALHIHSAGSICEDLLDLVSVTESCRFMAGTSHEFSATPA